MPTTIEGWVGFFILVIGFLSTAVVYFKGSRDKGTINTLSQNNAALTERVAILEADHERDLEKIEKLEARITELEKDKVALLAVRPSADVLAKLDADLQAHDRRVRSKLEQILKEPDG